MIELHRTGFDRQASLLGPRACFMGGFVPAVAAYLATHKVDQLDVGAKCDGLDQLADLQAKGRDSREGGQAEVRQAFVRLDSFAPRKRRFVFLDRFGRREPDVFDVVVRCVRRNGASKRKPGAFVLRFPLTRQRTWGGNGRMNRLQLPPFVSSRSFTGSKAV